LKKILVTGAAGQLGTDLALDLPRTRPQTQLLLTDLKPTPSEALEGFAYEPLDVTEANAIEQLLVTYKPDEIYHLAALLSGTAEKNPELAWKLNVTAFKSLLDLCVKHLPDVKIFFPSSIAVFGPGAGKTAAQKAYLDPTSMYGVTKVTGEQLAHYYHAKYQLDVRSLRFPGLISSKALPGGGTTDYSVEIFHAALAGPRYTCYLKKDTGMPFLYMPDALAAIGRLMEAPQDALTIRTSYNIHGFTATPADFAGSVTKALHTPLEVTYKPDFRQAIADSWPATLEDETARTDWGWRPTFGLEAVVKDMLDKLAHMQHSA
jgi:threonine 3-dehydrogenase